VKLEHKDPRRGIGGVIGRFIVATFFGGFVSLVILAIVLWVDLDMFWESPWPHVLWLIPMVWGILGIFWFDQMLNAGRKIFEMFFGIDR